MTPEIIAESFKAAGVNKSNEIISELKKAIRRVELRIDQAYESMPAALAHEATKRDRVLLKAQVGFLDHLEGRR